MQILLVCQTMTSVSGSPLYNYTLALELKKRGHDVSVFSMWEDNELRDNLTKENIMTFYSQPEGHFDLVFISQPDDKDTLNSVTADKIINIVHSEYDCETPIIDDKIDHYIAIREVIKTHLIKEHNIPKDKISVIHNGIDFERFNPSKRIINKKDHIKVVLPCTLDLLRKGFIEYYTTKATSKFRVHLYGTDYGMDFFKNEFVFVHPAVFDIENYIADADLIAGILLGRVNLEARSLNIVSYIHNPNNPENYEIYYPERKEFDKLHNIENVVKKILKLVDEI